MISDQEEREEKKKIRPRKRADGAKFILTLSDFTPSRLGKPMRNLLVKKKKFYEICWSKKSSDRRRQTLIESFFFFFFSERCCPAQERSSVAVKLKALRRTNPTSSQSLEKTLLCIQFQLQRTLLTSRHATPGRFLCPFPGVHGLSGRADRRTHKLLGSLTWGGRYERKGPSSFCVCFFRSRSAYGTDTKFHLAIVGRKSVA